MYVLYGLLAHSTEVNGSLHDRLHQCLKPGLNEFTTLDVYYNNTFMKKQLLLFNHMCDENYN